MENRKLTKKQEVFCMEYSRDPCGARAATLAGYSEKNARIIASGLLVKPQVKARIEDLMKERQNKIDVSVEYVINNLKEIAERCMQIKPVLDGDGNQKIDEDGNAVFVFNANGANKALELIGKHLGMFSDKINISGHDGGPLDSTVKIEFVRSKEKGDGRKD